MLLQCCNSFMVMQIKLIVVVVVVVEVLCESKGKVVKRIREPHEVKKNILLTSVRIEPTTSGLGLPLLCRLSTLIYTSEVNSLFHHLFTGTDIASHVLLQNDPYIFKAFIFFLSINTVCHLHLLSFHKIYSLSGILFNVSP